MQVILALLQNGRQFTTVIDIPNEIGLSPGIFLLIGSPSTGNLRVPISEIDISTSEDKMNILRVDEAYPEIDELLNNPNLEWFSAEHT